MGPGPNESNINKGAVANHTLNVIFVYTVLGLLILTRFGQKWSATLPTNSQNVSPLLGLFIVQKVNKIRCIKIHHLLTFDTEENS
ncbi:hypothetical protein MACH16_09180 [Marinomonas pontica]|uniref:Uncharacterized protein n=1 Tax=Marinomonas pontica TaxID=264739 RepID=A0ABM8FAS0_9GAMM|nr:hypothetical protein MACH16_09180 [Marinomonas pontica]